MHFEAESNGYKYEVHVNEERFNWKVSVKRQDQEWIHHIISKENFQNLDHTISFLFKDSSYLIDTKKDSETEYNIYCRGSYRKVTIYNDESLLHKSLKGGGALEGKESLRSGMPGKILKVFIKPGDQVKADQPLLIMEAMKMENEMRASIETKIKKVLVKEGDTIEAGATLVTFE